RKGHSLSGLLSAGADGTVTLQQHT
ncbi:hypothetical protein KIPB_014171, partial [Kipferlia bialata]